MAFLSAKVIIRSVDKCLKLHFQKQPLNWTICCFPWELIPFCNCPWVEGILVVIPNGFRLFHENSESQTSFVAIFPYSQPCLNFAEPSLCGQQSNPVSRQRFPENRTVFWLNPVSRQRFPTPALYFGQIPHPVNVFPNPALSFGQIPDSGISFGVIHQTRVVHPISTYGLGSSCHQTISSPTKSPPRRLLATA